MNLVNKENIARADIGKQPHHIALLGKSRPGGNPNSCSHFVGNHMGQRRLAQTGRPIKKNVLQRLAPLSRRLNRNSQFLPNPILPDTLLKQTRTQRIIELFLPFTPGLPADNPLDSHCQTSIPCLIR